ncbi:MAG: hypothetical protein SGPRY_011302 [Prymnesium sp.]
MLHRARDPSTNDIVSKGERSLEQESSPCAPPLPGCLRLERRLQFDGAEHRLYEACLLLLHRQGPRLGSFPEGREGCLEEFQPSLDVFRSFKARQMLYHSVASDKPFLEAYEQLVVRVVLPFLRQLLDAHDADVEQGGKCSACGTQRLIHAYSLASVCLWLFTALYAGTTWYQTYPDTHESRLIFG